MRCTASSRENFSLSRPRRKDFDGYPDGLNGSRSPASWPTTAPAIKQRPSPKPVGFSVSSEHRAQGAADVVAPQQSASPAWHRRDRTVDQDGRLRRRAARCRPVCRMAFERPAAFDAKRPSLNLKREQCSRQIGLEWTAVGPGRLTLILALVRAGQTYVTRVSDSAVCRSSDRGCDRCLIKMKTITI